MIDWVKKQLTVETTIGYMRVQLYRDDEGKAWRLATYHHRDSAMNFSRPLRTRDVEIAKKRALKFLIEVMTDKRDGIDAWLKQMKASVDEV
jgi:hypothetical protein